MFYDWFTKLFEATGFLTRDHCGPWSSSLVWTYILSNVVITLAYFSIPIYLYVIWRKRRYDIPDSWLFLFFAAFIAACGLTHICDIVVFWWPAYRLFTLISAVTAGLSVYTAVRLPYVTKSLVALPTLAIFHNMNRELELAVALKEEAIDESNTTIAALVRQIDHLERMRKTGLWVAEQESALRELKLVLDSSVAREGTK
jgi:two-component system, NtrC family, sensor kinase